MYYIKKTPSPRGYTELEDPVMVDKISGDCEVYMFSGELRGRFLKEIKPCDEKAIEVTYIKKYNDATTKKFVSLEYIDIDHMDFSLSKVPLISGQKKKIVSIDIYVHELEATS